MPLQVRPIAISMSVLFFFGISFIGWISGLSPFVCCKRALAGAVLAYITGTLAVKAINAVLMSALITKRINEDKEEDSGIRD
ncbi:MAG TPA: hypothetical protein VMW16_00615 [Sedimentisphaerales bacterium]|nr:hypothetical protein [Sedimentisphaerales bacterium]